MKLLVIPDVHGRDFWIEPCSHIDEFDKVIFLGDYHDPYYSQVDYKTSRKRLEEKLLPFVFKHQDKVICLFGNHDGNYLVGDMADRIDYGYQKHIGELLEQMNLKLIYKVDNYLFSHSGVLPKWLESNELTLEDLETLPFTNSALLNVSPYRGGWSEAGSCVWGDIREYASREHIPELYQIFGHTQLEEPVIMEDWACLDCRKAFVVDTEKQTIEEWKQ